MQEDVHLSYLPLAHMLERVVTTFVFSAGAQIGFYTGDVQNLFDDISTSSRLTCGFERWERHVADESAVATVPHQASSAPPTFSRCRASGTDSTTASKRASPSRASFGG